MGLAERLTERNPSMHGTPCSLGALIATLDGGELEALQVMLGGNGRRGWSATEIFDALEAEGYQVAYQTINRHRGGRCRCARGSQ